MKLRAFGNVFALLIVWVIIVVGFGSTLGANFMSVASLEQILRQSTVVALAGIGMTFVIMSGGIDLSVGSLVALASVCVALALDKGYDPSVALVFGIAVGVLCGCLNGLLITRLRVTPFIVTLGTFLAFRGIAKGLAQEQKIDADLTWLNDLLSRVPLDRKWMLFPPGVWAMIALACVAAFWSRNTRLGRYIVAVGSNEKASMYSGLSITGTKLAVYAFMGLCAGLSGVAIFARLSVGDPTTAQGLELQVIAAVVIGGASLSGGKGSIAGTLLGALIMETIGAGSRQLGWPNWVQEIVTGVIIVVAVALDRIRHQTSLPLGGS